MLPMMKILVSLFCSIGFYVGAIDSSMPSSHGFSSSSDPSSSSKATRPIAISLKTLESAVNKTKEIPTIVEGLSGLYDLSRNLQATNVILFKRHLDQALENISAKLPELLVYLEKQSVDPSETTPDKTFVPNVLVFIEEIFNLFTGLLESTTIIPGGPAATFNKESINQWHEQWKRRLQPIKPVDKETIERAALAAKTAADEQIAKIQEEATAELERIKQKNDEELNRVKEQQALENKRLQDEQVLLIQEEKRKLEEQQAQQLQQINDQVTEVLKSVEAALNP